MCVCGNPAMKSFLACLPPSSTPRLILHLQHRRQHRSAALRRVDGPSRRLAFHQFQAPFDGQASHGQLGLQTHHRRVQLHDVPVPTGGLKG